MKHEDIDKSPAVLANFQHDSQQPIILLLGLGQSISGLAADRAESETHLTWMADITRSLLRPETLRKIVDVVHFEWRGDIGDREFCP